MQYTEHLVGIGEDFSQRIHESLLSIRDDNLRRRDLIDGKDVVESLKSPRIIRLSFFSKKTEGN